MIPYLLIIGISLLPFLGIFLTPDLPHTHDGIVHLARMAAYYKALSDWQIPVRWAGDLNYGYGMPLFNFMYQLPYLISSFFIWAGAGLVTSFKLTLFISYLISGVGMFLFAKNLFSDFKKAFLITIFYQFASFRMVELFVRGSFGEVYTYAFFPLILYGVVKSFQKSTFFHFSLISFFGGLLIISHNALSLVFFGIATLFILIYKGKIKIKIFSILALGYSLLLAAFYWIPAILEHKYTYGDLFMKEMYMSHFVSPYKLLYPNFFNNAVYQVGGISVQFGIFHVIAIILSLIFINKTGKYKNIVLFSLFLIGAVFFFTQPISSFFWSHISLLRQFQFPWRFLGVSSFATSLLAISYFFLPFFKKKTVFVLFVVCVVLSSFVFFRPPLGFDKVDEKQYWNYPLNTTYFGETDLIWSAGPHFSYPKKRVEVISGDGKVLDFWRNSYRQNFSVDAKTSITLVDHTQYFPGWTAFVDKKEVPISFQDASWRGEIIFDVPKGNHAIEVIFKENKLRFLSNLISVTSVLVFILGLFLFRKKVL